MTIGLIGLYAVLLCPFIISMPPGGVKYLIARFTQLVCVALWGVLHLKKRNPVRPENRIFIYSVHLWWIVLIAVSLLRVPQLQFTQFNYWITVWNILLMAELYWSKDFVRHLFSLNVLFSLLIYLHVVLFILYPDGLWYETDWIGVGDKTRHLFGNYNQTGFIALIALMVNGLYVLHTGRGRLNMILLAIVSLVVAVVVGSMTSVIGLLVLTAYFLLRKMIKHPAAWIAAFFVVYVLFFVVIVWSGNNIKDWPLVATFLEDVLGKDSTFTLRIYLWINSVTLIHLSPWFGYGVQGVEWMAEQIGGSGAHDIWLMILLEGGAVLCTLFIAILANIFITAAKHRSAQSTYAVVCLCVALLMSLFETYHYVSLFAIVIIAYYTCVIKPENHSKHTTQISQVIQQ